MGIVQIGMLGIVGALLAIQFRSTRPEYAIYISVGVSLIIFVYAVNRLETIIGTIETISSYISINSSYMATLVKIIGITYIAEFSSAICKDAGYQTIAGQIEVFSKLIILAVSTPILLALLETINGFLS